MRSKLETWLTAFETLTSSMSELLSERADLIERLTIEASELPRIEQHILHARYIECLSWREIGRRMNFCISYLFKVHGRALKRIVK